MNRETWQALALKARQFRRTQQMRNACGNKREAYIRESGEPPEAVDKVWRSFLSGAKTVEDTLAREAVALVKGTPEGCFIDSVAGLSSRAAILCGMLHPMEDYPSPDNLHGHLGLYPGCDTNYSRWRKGFLIGTVVESCYRQGPYHAVYRYRRERTAETHPEMLAEGAGCDRCDEAYEKRRKTGKNGWDCGNMGGRHWSPAHQHQDALRYVAKLLTEDLWRVAHGEEAAVWGFHSPCADSYGVHEPQAVAAD